jgi:uncharacterized protein (DUF1778 family)
MGTKRKPGRPRKNSVLLKSESLLVRLEPDEKRAFSDAARLSGLDVSAWVRDRLRQVARKELEGADQPVAFLAKFQRNA